MDLFNKFYENACTRLNIAIVCHDNVYDLNFYCYFITCLLFGRLKFYARKSICNSLTHSLSISLSVCVFLQTGCLLSMAMQIAHLPPKPINQKGTEARQEHLTKGKYFECECRRCNDPTEFGTHLSSVRCQSCKLGYMIRMDCKTTWKCLNCNTNVETNKSN